MRIQKLSLLPMAACLALLASPAWAKDTPKTGAQLSTADTPQVDMKLLPQGAMRKVGFYMPQRVELAADKPGELKKAPEMSSPLYGQIKFGGKSYLVALDEPAGKEAKLYIDANGNGDLTDDPPAKWTKASRGAQYEGSFLLPLRAGDDSSNVSISAYRFDPNDAARAALKNTLLYYADYGYDGKVTLEGTSYHAMLINLACDGDFSAGGPNHGMFLIDINGDGKFDGRRESFNVGMAFNVKGTTWELTDLAPAGSFKIVKSAQTVAEIPFPPDQSKGQKAIAFKAQKMDGSQVNFPADYKGKLVILDFWATWCGPCMMEVPGLVKAYNEFHPKGLEILGISLDRPNAVDKIKSVTAEKGMTWPQVYDGKYWQARVAQLYGIESIPHAFLIDGDSGKVVAEGDALRGDGLVKTLRTALDEKAKRQNQ